MDRQRDCTLHRISVDLVGVRLATYLTANLSESDAENVATPSSGYTVATSCPRMGEKRPRTTSKKPAVQRTAGCVKAKNDPYGTQTTTENTGVHPDDSAGGYMADVNALIEAWPTLDDDTKVAILKLAGIRKPWNDKNS